ncbi:MAG: SLC13 family permease, partial [Gemmatimonadetes bacterium]|nr:SLC13 family permease [Gemmatimonadota bacterium]NIR77464.1 SLC13 family permease [Gemmatimonadota bacterium]NIT85988.1 SLC13 family permease [Gemmatimonadota bacterium]NIU29808.1 SLC13 family permease [Gemmatimonadota bacterium]NIU34830.1 SLC13 family permease [Gemmatimonadota bacterium]
AGSRKGGYGLGRLLVGVAGSSAFLNNTPIVAMLSPEVSSWAEGRGRSPSRYLMPISFASILGGTVTLIGTSTTIVVSGLLESHGSAPLGMFEITRLGLPVALAGIVYLWLAAPRLLPERRTALEEFEKEAREFTVLLRVSEGGPLEGLSVGESGVGTLRNVYVARVERKDGEVVAPVDPGTVLEGGDRLTVLCPGPRLRDLQRVRGAATAVEKYAPELTDAAHAYFEAVVGSASPLTGSTVRDAEFRERYGGVVLAIHRPGEGVRGDPAEVRLRTGDTLFVLAGTDFAERWKNRPDFVLVFELEGRMRPAVGKGLVAGVIVAGVVGLAALGILPILEAALLGAFAVLMAGILDLREAVRAIDLNVIVLIAAAFGLGRALEVTGLAGLAAGGLVQVFGGLGTWGALLGLVVATLILTELITNNAAAVLVFPIALEVAAGAGIDPRSAALALAVAASASFLTPIGYQTNTMVYGPGGYRFTDYLRLGLPLTILVCLMLPVLAAAL